MVIPPTFLPVSASYHHIHTFEKPKAKFIYFICEEYIVDTISFCSLCLK